MRTKGTGNNKAIKINTIKLTPLMNSTRARLDMGVFKKLRLTGAARLGRHALLEEAGAPSRLGMRAGFACLRLLP